MEEGGKFPRRREKYGGDKCVKVAGSVGKGLIKILSVFLGM